MSVAAVILAAGASRRLGRPKQNVLLAGETLLARAVRVARAAGLVPVIVVARPEAEFESTAPHIVTVTNSSPDEGIASSIRCGIQTAKKYGVDGVILMNCDQPGIRPEHLRALCAVKTAHAGSLYAGHVGTPAFFPARSFEELLDLQGDVGARKMLERARAVPAEEVSIDVDTEEDVAAARRLFESEAYGR